jgi:hypothetical protein
MVVQRRQLGQDLKCPGCLGTFFAPPTAAVEPPRTNRLAIVAGMVAATIRVPIWVLIVAASLACVGAVLLASATSHPVVAANDVESPFKASADAFEKSIGDIGLTFKPLKNGDAAKTYRSSRGTSKEGTIEQVWMSRQQNKVLAIAYRRMTNGKDTPAMIAESADTFSVIAYALLDNPEPAIGWYVLAMGCAAQYEESRHRIAGDNANKIAPTDFVYDTKDFTLSYRNIPTGDLHLHVVNFEKHRSSDAWPDGPWTE